MGLERLLKKYGECPRGHIVNLRRYNFKNIGGKSGFYCEDCEKVYDLSEINILHQSI